MAFSSALRPEPRWLRIGAILVIALFAGAALASQVVGAAIGRNGAVRAVEPDEIHNLPVYVDATALALTGLWAGIAAAAGRLRGRRGATAWALFAVTLVVLSLQRLAEPAPRDGRLPVWLPVGVPDTPLQAALLAAFVAAAAAWARAVATAASARARGRLLIGTGLLVAAAGVAWWARRMKIPGSEDLPLAVAGAAALGLALELAGVVAIAHGVTRHLAALTPEVRFSAVRDGSRLAQARAVDGGIEVAISTRRTARVAIAIVTALVAANVAAAWLRAAGWPGALRLYRWFYLDYEGNVPTWWSAMQLLLCGCVALAIAAGAHLRRDPRWGYWALLATLFVVLSSDEAASVHELMQKPLRLLLHSPVWLHYPLILPGLVAATALTLGFRRFARTLGSTRRWLVGGALVFAAGALGVETISGWYAPDVIGETLRYFVLVTLEETAEMAGVAIVLVGLLRHAAGESPTVRLALSAGREG